MDDVSATDLTSGDVTEVNPAEIDRDIESLDEEVRELIDAILAESDERLRLIVSYDGDDFELVYAREDVTDGFTEQELTTRVETVVMQSLGEPETEGPLYDFGALDATVRWYDEAAVAHLPTGEWSGLLFTFDRTTESLAELAGQFF